jgi:hypothetical protein
MKGSAAEVGAPATVRKRRERPTTWGAPATGEGCQRLGNAGGRGGGRLL